MMTILTEIVDYKKRLLANGYYDNKLKSLKDLTPINKPTFKSTLSKSKHLSIIAEIKTKSPSVPKFNVKDLVKQVQEYEANGAAAISILTDEHYFDGSFERLQNLYSHTTLPILCKDFIIDTIQIDVAKKSGASMILLIVHCLTDSKLKQLYKYAHKLGLEVLVEVHSIKELQRAHQLNASLIGINNRDLTTFNTHVEHTNQILRQKHSGRFYISESGIHSREDVLSIVQTGISGILIGGALMNCTNISEFLPSLMLEKVNL